MQSPDPLVVVLATGGTIAGLADKAGDNTGYRAGQVGIAELLAALPASMRLRVEAEQVAQIDSKDADFAFWQRLAQRVAAQLARAEVRGVVVTHGTDTLEETAYLLHRVLAPAKPVVLSAAMRPANALSADGPQNLLDALALAAHAGARGVLATMAGRVFSAPGLRKAHSRRLDALDAGDAGPLGRIDDGRLSRWRPWSEAEPLGLAAVARAPAQWPRVEIVLSHAGADGAVVDALLAQPPRVAGLIVAGTGNGTIHQRLEAALRRALAAGVAVRRSTRCAGGGVVDGVVDGVGDGVGDGVAAGTDDALPSAGELTPVQARIELLLELLAAGRTR